MVFILHRYIFREVFKVFVLAAVALTVMLSLGSILQPIQQYGIGPRQVVHLMGYSLPVTLTFVLPMAALFAATLVYGRFASDNELDACRASGISLMTLAYPGLVLAIMVAIANLILSFYVMPDFVKRAEKSLKADARQILFRNLQRKGYYLLPDGRYRIYADLADEKKNALAGVIVVEAKKSQIRRIITSENAVLSFNPHDRANEVGITAYNTYQMNLGDNSWFFIEKLPLTAEFGSLLGDNIKFKKVDEMKLIRADPTRFYPIEKMALETYAQFAMELLAQDIIEKTAGSAAGTYRMFSNEKLVEFAAGDCSVKDERKIRLSGNVTLNEYDMATGRLIRRWQCSQAMLYLETDELASSLTMELYSPIWQQPDGKKAIANRYAIRGLTLPGNISDKFDINNLLGTVGSASAAIALKKGPSSHLANMQNELWKKIQKTLNEIDAEIHSRLVFGTGCILIVMIGIGLGIMLKGGHLLSAFGASSVPAAVLIVCIMMGKNITNNPGTRTDLGIVMMWAGLAVLAILTVAIYRKLLKT